LIRTFVAIEIPRLPELSNLLDRLRMSGSKVSVPKAENVHITLKFLGDVNEGEVDRIIAALKEASSGFSQSEARMIGTGVFPGQRDPRVFWVGIEDGGATSMIAKAVDERASGLGFEAEKRPFTPHITVARVKSSSGIEKSLGILREYEKTDFGSFRIEDVRLKKSTLTPGGPIYEDLGVVPLTAGGPSRR